MRGGKERKREGVKQGVNGEGKDYGKRRLCGVCAGAIYELQLAGGRLLFRVFTEDQRWENYGYFTTLRLGAHSLPTNIRVRVLTPTQLVTCVCPPSVIDNF